MTQLASRAMSPRLRRYTDLPSLLNILSQRELTLLDPQSWDDKNDASYMALYKDGIDAGCLLALCFSQAPETYHHWKVFSSGSSGACITFNSEKLIGRINEYEGMRCGSVRYLSMQDARENPPDLHDLPFVKRIGYKDEAEFRVVYEGSVTGTASINIPIELSMIEGISLSPWLHKSLSDSTKDVIRRIHGCSKIKLSRSTLTSNDEWTALAEKQVIFGSKPKA
jgi:hypothetical protein